MPDLPREGTSLTLGTVSYLNVQPMIWAIQNGPDCNDIKIIPEVPRLLADNLAAGAYDTAIVPVFEYFRHPGLYTYVPGPVIASHGAVRSVILYSSDPLERLKTVYLDSSSLTSVHLFKVIAAEKGLNLNYLDTAEHPVPMPLPDETGWVVIGDPAIAQIGKHPHSLDLGEAWENLTRLPFVFAAWLVPSGVDDARLVPLLQSSLTEGLANLERVANDSAAAFNVTPEFALYYFQEAIYYHLGEKELAGWEEFGRLCYKHGFIAEQQPLRPFEPQIRPHH